MKRIYNNQILMIIDEKDDKNNQNIRLSLGS